MSREGAKRCATYASPSNSSPPCVQARRLGANSPCDPVCRMAVDPDRAAGRLMHDGTAYFFCTLACAGEFAREPERYVA